MVVHETHDVPVPTTCPCCGGPVRETHVAAQYQEDLSPVTPIVRRFDVHVGQCHACHRRVQGRHPLQTSDALGAAAVQLGPHAIALAVRVDWRRTDVELEHRLRFGAIELVLAPNGQYHFLEINPNGQWLWLEDKLGFPITDNIAQWLRNL